MEYFVHVENQKREAIIVKYFKECKCLLLGDVTNVFPVEIASIPLWIVCVCWTK